MGDLRGAVKLELAASVVAIRHRELRAYQVGVLRVCQLTPSCRWPALNEETYPCLAEGPCRVAAQTARQSMGHSPEVGHKVELVGDSLADRVARRTGASSAGPRKTAHIRYRTLVRVVHLVSDVHSDRL